MTPSALLARLAVTALRAAGVEHVVLCPGSRSAPLAYALLSPRDQAPRVGDHAPRGGDQAPGVGDHAGPTVHVRHDERVAGFTALGVGRSTSHAAGAVVTTSGTAVANLHPAVLEAHHGNVPLVVVSADRPPALRGTWANQTSDLQAGLFGGALRAALDLDDVTASADPAAALDALCSTLAAAYGRAAGERPGPVQLNLGFTDPLVPTDDEPDVDLPVPQVRRPRRSVPGTALDPGERALVVAGDPAGAPAGWTARWFAEAAGLPLLAEPSSGARSGRNVVDAYRLLLELPELTDDVERVVCFGRPTLSRPVTRLLAREDVDVVLVGDFDGWPDPGRPVRRVAGPVVPQALSGAAEGWHRPDPGPWAARWLAAGAAARTALDGALDAGALTGPLVAREVLDATTHPTRLVVGSSNAIRDLDLAGRAERVDEDDLTTMWNPLVLAGRGLAGIDGTLSTATGLALAEAAPVRALVGDLTFLHDANALLPEPGSPRPDLQVVLLDDGGGGIFSLLEHGARARTAPDRAALFERAFGTPHGVDVEALCRAYGVGHVPATTAAELRSALAQPDPGTSVVHVRLPDGYRAGLPDLHAGLRSAVHAAARAALA